MRSIIHILSGLLLILFASCGSGERAVRESGSGLARCRTLADQKYGQGVEFLFNNDTTAVLCLKKWKPTAQVPQQRVAFFVFDLAADTVMYEDNVPNGAVQWKGDFCVVVNITPGIEQAEDASPPTQHGYIYDIRIRKVRELGSAPVQ